MKMVVRKVDGEWRVWIPIRMPGAHVGDTVRFRDGEELQVDWNGLHTHFGSLASVVKSPGLPCEVEGLEPYYICTKCGTYRTNSENSVRGIEVCDCGYVMIERVPSPAQCPPLVREALEEARNALENQRCDLMGLPVKAALLDKISKAMEAIS